MTPSSAAACAASRSSAPCCGSAWDERVVAGSAAVAEEPDLTLCPSCLLTTSHGDPFPDDPTASEARSTQEA